MDNNTHKFKFQKTTVWRIIFLTAVFYFLTLFLQAAPVLAGSALDLQSEGKLNEVQSQLGVSNQDIRITIARIIRVAFGLLGIVFVCIVIWGGFLYMTAGGEERKIEDAKKIIFNGIIGLIIMLSAFSIATFVISRLSSAAGGGTLVDAPGTVQTNAFGSGALGSIIRDHYPGRGELDVPRNTRIIISFRRAVLASSFVNDTNSNGILGDCTTQNFNWETSCDSLRLDNNIINITRADTDERIRGAAALISYENNQAFTVTIRPYDALGSNSDRVTYNVRIGNGVLLDDSANNNPSIFQGRSSNYYEWDFTCSTVLDTRPPTVTDVFPARNTVESRNSVIQINFSKPMDPTGLQGSFAPQNNYFALVGNNIYLQSRSSTIPVGNFRLVNNYRTLEFTPSIPCGTNACGGTVYCLPVCNQPGANCTQDNYEVLIRAADTFTTSSFEAIPYSGAMDASGNALDNTPYGVVNKVNRSGEVFSTAGQKQSDNYFWNFSLSTDIDTTPPYIQQTTPGTNAQNVSPTSELSVLFSERMNAGSLYDIDIIEYPASDEPLCRVPRATFNANGTTFTEISHCPFLNAESHYYYPLIDSNVQDVHFNCFYPGRGPVGLNTDQSSYVCDETHLQNCCPVGSAPDASFCCNGRTGFTDKQTCLNALFRFTSDTGPRGQFDSFLPRPSNVTWTCSGGVGTVNWVTPDMHNDFYVSGNTGTNNTSMPRAISGTIRGYSYSFNASASAYTIIVEVRNPVNGDYGPAAIVNLSCN